KHSYTKALLSVVPVPDVDIEREKILLTGETPNPINIPQGCRFHTRCPWVEDHCRLSEPELRDMSDGRRVACFSTKDD
ncbi:MAG: oligopeptide ABC transporter ATP-binding protein, partial [Candidatus Thorarchaeota archaeon]